MRELVGAVACLCLLAGCAAPKPVKLRVETPDVDGATLQTKGVAGNAPTTPDNCTLPCSVVMPVGSVQLSIRSPGYYPADFTVDYGQVVNLGGDGKETLLRVPLKVRPQDRESQIPEPTPESRRGGAASTSAK